MEKYEQQDAAFDMTTAAYGDDCIIVYKPEDLDYYMTTSHNVPARTYEVLKEVVHRMAPAFEKE